MKPYVYRIRGSINSGYAKQHYSRFLYEYFFRKTLAFRIGAWYIIFPAKKYGLEQMLGSTSQNEFEK
jgi:hypothetical protein